GGRAGDLRLAKAPRWPGACRSFRGARVELAASQSGMSSTLFLHEHPGNHGLAGLALAGPGVTPPGGGARGTPFRQPLCKRPAAHSGIGRAPRLRAGHVWYVACLGLRSPILAAANHVARVVINGQPGRDSCGGLITGGMPDPAGRGIIRLIRLAVLTLVSILACPALAPRLSAAKAAAPPEDASPRGLLLVVGGVGGLELMANAAQWALPRAGIHHEVHDFIWTHGKGKILSDLQDARHCLKKADELAAQILLFKAEDLDRPIYILAKSGGTGLVLAAAEQLPPNTIERIVLLSAAVSPTYDLRPALRATEHGIVSFYS